MPFLFSFFNRGDHVKGRGGNVFLFVHHSRPHSWQRNDLQLRETGGRGTGVCVGVCVWEEARAVEPEPFKRARGNKRPEKKRTTIASGCAQYQAAASCPSLFRRHPNSSPSARQRALASLGGDTNYKIKITVSTDRYESVWGESQRNLPNRNGYIKPIVSYSFTFWLLSTFGQKARNKALKNSRWSMK